MSSPLRVLPSIADLFFLPRMISAEAQTEIDEQAQALQVTMPQLTEARQLHEKVSNLPHVQAMRTGKQVTIQTKRTTPQHIVVHWPDSKAYGASLYDDGHYSLCDANTLIAAVTAGVPVLHLEAVHQEGMLAPLERYYAECKSSS